MGFGWAGFLGSGRVREAVAQLERAVQEDPLHLTYRTCLALALGALERFDDAEEVLAKSREIDPDFFWTYDVLTSHYIARDLMSEARSAAERTFTPGAMVCGRRWYLCRGAGPRR